KLSDVLGLLFKKAIYYPVSFQITCVYYFSTLMSSEEVDNMIKVMKNEWVEIESILMKVSERSELLPSDTAGVPLKSYSQGFLINDEASIGDNVSIKTLSNREISGKLIDLSPEFVHDFGKPVSELLNVGLELRQIMDN